MKTHWTDNPKIAACITLVTDTPEILWKGVGMRFEWKDKKGNVVKGDDVGCFCPAEGGDTLDYTTHVFYGGVYVGDSVLRVEFKYENREANDGSNQD